MSDGKAKNQLGRLKGIKATAREGCSAEGDDTGDDPLMSLGHIEI
jgi:hypothetical protein